MDALLVLFEVERALLRVALLALCFRMLRSVWLARAANRSAIAGDSSPHALKTVTVQIPLRNEYCVAERVIRAVAALDYPRHLLEIQVLDQSDDETVGLVERTVRELAASGVPIVVIRRDPDAGCKSDSLAHGLSLSSGELVAIFDADCVPKPDFLRRAVTLFTDDDIGLVQGRLSFLNREASMLTRAQAQLLDGLMLVDQVAESRRRGGVLHFNGSAGVWRRACLDAVGGWLAGPVTEDFDVSCRASLAGWRLVHAPELDVPAELPETMSAFRTQQRRWTRGHMNVLRDAVLTLRRGRGGALHTARLFFHMARRSIFLFLALLLVSWPLTTFSVVKPLIEYSTAHDVSVLAAVVLCAAIFLLRGQQLARRSLWREAFVLPMSLGLFFGMSVGCALSSVAGLVKRTAVFARTPKRGTDAGPARYPSKLDLVALVEIATSVLYAVLTVLALSRGLYLHAAFMALVTGIFTWVGGSVLIESVSDANQSSPSVDLPEAITSYEEISSSSPR